MEQQVRIRIRGTQKYKEKEMGEDTTALETLGQYYFRNGSHYITFSEKDPQGQGEINSILKIKEETVELTRKGSIGTKMLFEREKEYSTMYTTPCGAMKMTIRTQGVRVLKTEKKLTLNIQYTSWLEDIEIADNRLEVVIRALAFSFI